jgi:hypothetical protein
MTSRCEVDGLRVGEGDSYYSGSAYSGARGTGFTIQEYLDFGRKIYTGFFSIDTDRSTSKTLLLVTSKSYMLTDKIFMMFSFEPLAIRRFKNWVRQVTWTLTKLSKYRYRYGAGVLLPWNSYGLEVLVGAKTLGAAEFPRTRVFWEQNLQKLQIYKFTKFTCWSIPPYTAGINFAGCMPRLTLAHQPIL